MSQPSPRGRIKTPASISKALAGMPEWSLYFAGGLVALIVVGLLVFVFLPDWFAPERAAGFGPSAEAAARHDVRTSALQLFGGVVLAMGAVFAARNVRVAQLHNEIERESQITERFTRAIDQLGHGNRDVRMGGIYALERIARDSSADHQQVTEVLTAFVREHAPWPPKPSTGPDAPGEDATETATSTDSILLADPRYEASLRMPTDVQASLTAIGRRVVAHDLKRHVRLDLKSTDLRGADLERADLSGVTLREANLEDANFKGAKLAEADLLGAELAGASFECAKLPAARLQQAQGRRRAYFMNAELTRARLVGAKLRGANFTNADLTDADLVGAEMTGALLKGATLKGTELTITTPLDGADLSGTNLVSTVMTHARLSAANLEGADLRGVSLELAKLARAHLEGAQLNRAKLTSADLSEARLDDAGLVGADLSHARLTGSHLERANLSGADLGYAKLEGSFLDRARFDTHTQWPSGFDPVAAGAVPVSTRDADQED